ncbi:unnamed protein product [Trichobilharzia regenti]|nr:unnamed protein product [Trichobilharzia regenti]
MTKGSRRSGYRKNSMVSSNPHELSECNSFRGTSPTDRLQAARQRRLCFTRLQEVHANMYCEEVTKFSGKLNLKSRSNSELCDDSGAVKKPVVATGKPLLNRVSKTTPQFVQEKGVTISESSSDSTSFQSITSQSEGIKPLRIC